MENLNLHKQKLIALVISLIGLISMLLPWLTVRGIKIKSGFFSWGLIGLIGIAGVVAASFMGDKTKEYDAKTKMIAMGSFGAISLAGILTFLTKNNVKGEVYGQIVRFKANAGFGVYLAIIVGIVGLAWVMGLIKIPENKPSSSPPQAPKA